MIDDSAIGRSRKYYIWAIRRSTLELFINDLNKKHNIVDVVQVRTCSSYDWNIKVCPIRPIASILSPAPIAEMIEDAQKFTNEKERYAYLGIPYRRGYLLEGLPGTGKSSSALCLAGVLKRPLYFMSLTNKNANDEWLLDMFARVPFGSIILVDDYDRFVPSTDGGITIAGLLNALDGVVAQTGKIIIIAANDISNIPDAILRPGRIDRRFTFGLTEKEDAMKLFERFHGSEHKTLFGENFPSPKAGSAIISHLMRYENPFEAAENAGSIF
jgi:chaperone BCS1